MFSVGCLPRLSAAFGSGKNVGCWPTEGLLITCQVSELSPYLHAAMRSRHSPHCFAIATQTEANTPSLEWINRPAAKYSCYLSFWWFPSLPSSLFLPAPPIIQTSGFAPLQATFSSPIFLLIPLLSSVCLSLLSTFFSIHLTCSYLSNSTLAAAVPESIRVD